MSLIQVALSQRIFILHQNCLRKATLFFLKWKTAPFCPLESLLSFDEENDVALLKVTANGLPSLKLAQGHKAKQGENIVVIGSPLGLETTVSDGIISSIRGKEGLIQITAPISPGSSGSPVLNLKGEVLGIASFNLQGGQNLNFAVPVKVVVKLLQELKISSVDKQRAKETKRATGKREPEREAKSESSQSPTSSHDGGNDSTNPATNSPSTTTSNLPFAREAPIQDPELARELEEARKGVRNVPDNSDAYIRLGLAYRKLNMPHEAQEAYREAIKIKYDFAEAYCGLGYVLLDIGKLNDALNAFMKTLILKELPEAYNGMCQIHVMQGLHLTATGDCLHALSLRADYTEAHYNIGLAYIGFNDKKAVLKEIDILKKLDTKLAARLFEMLW